MPDASASAGGLTVTVRANLIGAWWDFGDGHGLESGLGRANEGDVQHTYETDSYGRHGGYQVAGWLRYQVSYSVNGGGFVPLGVKTLGYAHSYEVNQLQPIAVN
jgi:hypothetical protein